ncbi:hypothetical protein OH76DRAFT_1394723 [Lentinus brumalis]|uniref:Uncharacterized protein n=1 Tax=Lentinus brumalis TaxID=2498619 RepID=A0A371DWS0_9APHY|nr:hypothetical protein OH76DRAFT_1394723 [Polyporus brumalis]
MDPNLDLQCVRCNRGPSECHCLQSHQPLCRLSSQRALRLSLFALGVVTGLFGHTGIALFCQ